MNNDPEVTKLSDVPSISGIKQLAEVDKRPLTALQEMSVTTHPRGWSP